MNGIYRIDQLKKLAPLLILAGPTAVGKSKIATELAEELGTEIVNADSMQVYKYFDIGTAKPDLKTRHKIPHHLIDICEPDEEYNSAKFINDADSAIKMIYNKSRIPILVGGTGLYIKSLVEGLTADIEPDIEIRQELKRELEEKGLQVLYQELCKVDEVSAKKIKPNDKTRILRALEVYRQFQIPLSDIYKFRRDAIYCVSSIEKRKGIYNPLSIFLNRDRDELYERINSRVDEMIERGLEDEVKKILDMGYSKELKPFKSIGYLQMINYLEGKISFDEMVKDIKQSTRRYAKRQITWFKHQGQFEEINLSHSEEKRIVNMLKKKLENAYSGKYYKN